jgi:cell division cycle 20-like protein 1, cofactor of APC complex
MATEPGTSLSIDTSNRPQTPTLPTPLGSKTPPTISAKRFIEPEAGMSAMQRATEAREADALNRRLREFESAGRQRDVTPGRSPSRKRQRVYGDR